MLIFISSFVLSFSCRKILQALINRGVFSSTGRGRVRLLIRLGVELTLVLIIVSISLSVFMVVILVVRKLVHGETLLLVEAIALLLLIFCPILWVLYKYRSGAFFVGYTSSLLNMALFYLVLKGIPSNDTVVFTPDLFVIGLGLSFILAVFMDLYGDHKQLAAQKSVSSLLTAIGTFAGLCWGFLSYVDPHHGSAHPTFYAIMVILLYSIYPIHISVLLTDMLQQTQVLTRLKSEVAVFRLGLRNLRKSRQG